MVQPLELHLQTVEGKPDGTLVKITERWGETDEPELIVKSMPVIFAGGLEKAVEAAAVELPILLVFTEPKMTYGQLLDYIRPVLKTHGLIHVYLPINGS